MSFLEKLAFWKKEEENFDDIADQSATNFNDPMKTDLGVSDPFNNSPTTPQPNPDPFNQLDGNSNQIKDTQPPQYKSQNINETNVAQNIIDKKEIELINSKLDTIKVLLESLNQKVSKMDQKNQTSSKEGHNLW